MGLQNEIQTIIDKYNSLNLISKMQKIPLEMTSKFSVITKIKNISKLSKLPKDIKSDLDLQIPMDVAIYVLCEGKNRDGKILAPSLIESTSLWGDGLTIIPGHDMDDMANITTHDISQDCGFTDSARIETIKGTKWIVVDARITNRNIAYQMYLREQKGEPIQISAEYKWNRDYDFNGETIQTNIRPGVISLVDNGHIEGNQLKILNQV